MPVFVAFLLLSAALARLLGTIWHLPLALALLPGMELLGEVLFLWWLPRWRPPS